MALRRGYHQHERAPLPGVPRLTTLAAGQAVTVVRKGVLRTGQAGVIEQVGRFACGVLLLVRFADETLDVVYPSEVGCVPWREDIAAVSVALQDADERMTG